MGLLLIIFLVAGIIGLSVRRSKRVEREEELDFKKEKFFDFLDSSFFYDYKIDNYEEYIDLLERATENDSLNAFLVIVIKSHQRSLLLLREEIRDDLESLSIDRSFLDDEVNECLLNTDYKEVEKKLKSFSVGSDIRKPVVKLFFKYKNDFKDEREKVCNKISNHWTLSQKGFSF